MTSLWVTGNREILAKLVLVYSGLLQRTKERRDVVWSKTLNLLTPYILYLVMYILFIDSLQVFSQYLENVDCFYVLTRA